MAGAPATVRLASTQTTASLQVWVAQQQGYFEKNNIDIKADLVTAATAAQAPSLLGKQYDVAQVPPTVLIAGTTSGIDIVAISAMSLSTAKNSSVRIIASPSSGIKTAKDLVGKRMATPSVGGNVNAGTKYWLKKNGVDPKSVNIVAASTPNIPDLFAAGQIDAAQMLRPYSAQMIEKGYVDLGDPFVAIADEVTVSLFASDRSWVKANPKVAKAFTASLEEASVWINKNPKKALELLASKTDTPAELLQYMKLPDYSTKLSPKDLERWLGVMESVDGFSTSVKMKDLVVQG